MITDYSCMMPIMGDLCLILHSRDLIFPTHIPLCNAMPEQPLQLTLQSERCAPVHTHGERSFENTGMDRSSHCAVPDISVLVRALTSSDADNGYLCERQLLTWGNPAPLISYSRTSTRDRGSVSPRGEGLAPYRKVYG